MSPGGIDLRPVIQATHFCVYLNHTLLRHSIASLTIHILIFPYLPISLCVNTIDEEITMATVSSSAVAVPSFSGLRANAAKVNGAQKVMAASPSQRVRSGVKASLKEVGAAVVATAASAMIASNAMALEVLLGGDDGSLAFVPSDFSVNPGEKIVFKNNAGFPHNVVFDEDEIPGGVDASKISMPEEELLNGPGETYVVTLTEKGSYSFYCSPHQGAGMVGKVTVN